MLQTHSGKFDHLHINAVMDLFVALQFIECKMILCTTARTFPRRASANNRKISHERIVHYRAASVVSQFKVQLPFPLQDVLLHRHPAPGV